MISLEEFILDVIGAMNATKKMIVVLVAMIPIAYTIL
jgi:hypothetical protein